MKKSLRLHQMKLYCIPFLNRVYRSIKINFSNKYLPYIQKIKNKFNKTLFITPIREREFLPSDLEITDTPPSPIGRAISWTIVLFISFVFFWAFLSKMDVVAIASGKLAPIGEVKVIQPLEQGIAREIAVSEGQHVKKGDLLLSLDPTTSQADEVNLGQRLMHLRCEVSLYDSLLQWDSENPKALPNINFPYQIEDILEKLYKERMKQEILVIASTLDSLKSKEKSIAAQIQRVKTSVIKYEEILKIDHEVSKTYLTLYKKSISSRFQWLSAEQARIKTEKEKADASEQIEELQATQRGIQLDMAKAFSIFQSEQLRKKADAETEIASIEQELAKANLRNSLKILTSPVSGYVQQLSVHTLGGIVPSGEVTMIIVPDDNELQLKANVMNKDIGFIKVGQTVQVKLEAFPFTEYGMIDGEVVTISADAVQNDQGNLLYPCTIKLNKNNILVNKVDIALRPGMVATGEIVLRKRRVIDYFLSPLLKYSHESLRER